VARKTLNLGILAHVDAGKTTLTERLLYDGGVIAELGSVDAGTTHTDTLALERQRGITIRAAVVSFAIGDVTVNLIDTPGHPDFIAEVERSLAVLDGAVLVVSAVEGVQAQTRVLWRALERLRIPTIFFVNKTDRVGADCDRVCDEIRRHLTPALVRMDGALVEAVVENDEALLADYVDGGGIDDERLRLSLARQTGLARLHPVYCGSALSGEGVPALAAGVLELLPHEPGDPEAPLACAVFKIDRGKNGEKVAYARLFAGTIRARETVFGEKVTAIAVFDQGGAVQRPAAIAGEIAQLSGLRRIRIGDFLGTLPRSAARQEFARPTLETVVDPLDPDDGHRLKLALARLAEQDPLIDVRQDDTRSEISLSLYGEVQQEVVEATLADDYGLAVAFRETTAICIERPTGTGEAVEILNTPTNPFHTDLGLRVEPAAPGSGIEVRISDTVDPRDTPLYIFGTLAGFADQMAVFVRSALVEGLHGWETTDCVVTVTKIGYSLADGPPSRRGSMPNTRDIRRLVPIVLLQALEQAGCAVCEPVFRIGAEVPSEAIGPVLAALGRLGAGGATPVPRGELAVLEATLPASRVQELRRRLPGLTGGEGILDSEFAGYEPVLGEPPVRTRTTPDPRNLDEYLARVGR
jgi:ribosomal protection tetracycline resistance protein